METEHRSADDWVLWSEEGSQEANLHFLYCLFMAVGCQATKNGVMWKNNVAITNAMAKPMSNFHYLLIISE
jgi:hypothetical protein